MSADLMETHFPWKTKRGNLCLGVHDSKGYPVAVIHERPDQEANARLVASAPAMLAALRMALMWASLNKQRAGTLGVQQIEEAIKSATEHKECRRCKNALDGVNGLCPDGYGHVEP